MAGSIWAAWPLNTRGRWTPWFPHYYLNPRIWGQQYIPNNSNMASKKRNIENNRRANVDITFSWIVTKLSGCGLVWPRDSLAAFTRLLFFPSFSSYSLLLSSLLLPHSWLPSLELSIHFNCLLRFRIFRNSNITSFTIMSSTNFVCFRPCASRVVAWF